MSITEANLLVRVKKRTKRDELSVIGDNSTSDFTYYVKKAVRRLSMDSLSLKGSATGTLTASTNTFSIPSDMIDAVGAIDGITLGTNSNSNYDPELYPMSWTDYLSGKMRGFSLRDSTVYVRPIPDTNQTYTIYYRKFHGSTVSTLEFDDKYEECLIPLLCHYIWEDLGNSELADEQEVRYKRKLDEVDDSDGPPITQIPRMRS